MCGRYEIELLDLPAFESVLGEPIAPLGDMQWQARYNVAPTQPVPIVRRARDGHLEAADAKWGLLPYWSKQPKASYSTINARVETVERQPAFKAAFARRRCLVPATGWYEWQPVAAGSAKQPYRLRLPPGQPHAFAGLWERWRSEDKSQTIESCTIIVGDAAAPFAAIHDRMPCVLRPEDYKAWLDPELENDTERLKTMLAPYIPPGLVAYRVGPLVNSPKNESAELVRPIDDEVIV